MTKNQIIKNHLFLTIQSIAKRKDSVISNKNYSACISNLNSSTLNLIYFKNYDKNLIEKLIKQKINFSCVSDDSCAEEIEKLYNDYGLTIESDYTTRIKNDLEKFEYVPSKDIKIIDVSTLEQLDEFDYISSVCFSSKRYELYNNIAQKLKIKDIKMYLSTYNNITAGIGMLSTVNNQAGIYWGAVLPEFRNKGIATEITKFRLLEAKNLGFKSIIVINAKASSGYCHKLGFKTIGKFKIYEKENP